MLNDLLRPSSSSHCSSSLGLPGIFELCEMWMWNVNVPSEKDCACLKTVYVQTKTWFHGVFRRCRTAVAAWMSLSWELRRHTLAAGSICGWCFGRRSIGVSSPLTEGWRTSCCSPGGSYWYKERRGRDGSQVVHNLVEHGWIDLHPYSNG